MRIRQSCGAGGGRSEFANLPVLRGAAGGAVGALTCELGRSAPLRASGERGVPTRVLVDPLVAEGVRSG